MKYLFIVLFIALTLCSANENVKVKNLEIKNAKFNLDRELAEEFLLKYVQAQTLRDGEITAVVNEYADKVFANIHPYSLSHGLDPILLSNVSQDFLASSITLTNGLLKGISTISRSKDVRVSYQSTTRELEVYLPIVFSNLNFTYDYHVIVLLIGPKGEIVGKINNFEMDINLLFDFNTYHAKVLQLKTTDSGHVDVIFHGNGLVDLVVNILSEFVTTILHPLIGLVVEGTVSKAATFVVDAVNQFIDGIFSPTTASPLTTSGLY